MRVAGLLCLVWLAGLACGGGGKAQPTPEPTDTAADLGLLPVIGLYSQQQFAKEYAGDCAQTDPTKDAGKLCSNQRGAREGMTAYLLNAVGGAPFAWLVVAG